MDNTILEEFYNRLNDIYSKEDIELVKKGLNIKKRLVSFRINTLKSSTKEILEELDSAGLKYKKIDFLTNGYLLLEGVERDLWDLEVYKTGKIYVQGISSQIPVELFNFTPGEKVLDLTAAPGSKTSQISVGLNNSGEVVAIDNSGIRVEKLKYTIENQGLLNTRIIKIDSRQVAKYFNDSYFDKILLDAPCTSEGRINLNIEKTYNFWEKNMFKKKYYTQKDMLDAAIPLLKTGGGLVYSTCTIAPEENEDIVHYLLCNYPELQIEEIKMSSENFRPGLKGFRKKIYKKEVGKSLRVLPTEEMEGFFVAKFVKK